ncbi:hypothetical protein V7S43_012338 [Phytophthora oleae]|uniref:Uncharacterized protein n=1 Tax=Phytophthora oleae TaxID=2107226 RepID=A0ABD3F6W8_9STRA
MGRTVKVCGTPTAIALDVERGESEFKNGCVLQTAVNGLVLRGVDESLRVVDARKFCAGFVDVRHVVELPSGATFIRRKSSGGNGIAWKTTLDDDGEWSGTIYIVDFQTGEVVVRTLPRLNEMVADIFVDEYGEQVAVVGATSGRLYGWSVNGRDYNDRLDARGQSEWRIVESLTIDAVPVGACSCWRFVSSAVMGNCFVFMRARPNTSGGSIVIEKWVFDVESNWLPVAYSSRTLETSDAESTEGLALFITETWKFMILTVGKVLYHFQIDQDLTDCPVKRLILDHHVLDGTWIDQDAFAILLVNGQISIASVSDGCFKLLGIETSSTMSKRLSLSTLLGKAVPAALQLVWIAQEKQIIVDFGATRSAFKLEVANEQPPLTDGGRFDEPIALSTSDVFPPFNRRMLRRTNCGDYIRELLEGNPPPCANDLLDISGVALTRSQETFEDLYFTVLSKVHRQLADDFAKASNSDPIDWVGKSLKLMEVVVSLTVSLGGATLRQISSKILSILPGCTAQSDRKFYYRKEIEAISSQVRKVMNGIGESEDWWVYSMEVAAFLGVYFTTIQSLFQDIQSSANLKPGEASQILSLCQWTIEHQDGLDALARGEKHNDPSVERLKGLLISYTIVCCYLRVNGVIIDLEHLFPLVSHITLRRKEFFCCFLKPWQLNVSADTPAMNDALSQAVTFAAKSNAMHLLIDLCMESRSLAVHSCVQALCSAAGTMTIADSDNILQVKNLHWQACETYIGEVMAILRRIGARWAFKYSNREAEWNSGCFSVAIDAELAAFLRSFSAEVARSPTKFPVAPNNSSLWEFSRLENGLRARVICLISRILWHLEAGSEDIGGLFQHAFAMIDAQVAFSSETQLFDCLTEVRAVVNPIESELRLLRFRQAKDSRVEFCCRSQTIARSLVLVTWALWLREKSAYCSRGIRIGGMENATTEMKIIGTLAATCALSLHALAMVYGKNEELLNTQLSLLEDAATINPSKATAVIAWGFPTRKIQTRYLKRYKILRQAVQRSSVDMPLKDKELHLQQLQTRVRNAFYRALGSFGIEEPTERNTSDIDVLVACCCDLEALQIVSVLATCPCEVVTTTNPVAENTLLETRTSALELPGKSRDKGGSILPSTTVNEVHRFPMPQVPDSLISRDEVIALLQAQTKHLEEKMQAVADSGQSTCKLISYEDTQAIQTDELPVWNQGKTRAASEKVAGVVDKCNETAVRLADSQRMARISLQVRELRRHRYSSASSEAEVQSNPQDKPIQRHDSVRNALKLFRLRQENCVQPPSENLAASVENAVSNVENWDNSAVGVKDSVDTRSPAAVATRRDKLKRGSAKQKSSRNHRSSGSQSYSSSRERVYPLRLEYGTDSASLKLLGRNSQQYNPSVKRRQFVHQQRERLPKAYARTSNTDVEPAEVVQLKTVSAQTNDLNDSVSTTAKEEKELLNSEQDDLEPEKGSPVIQECDDVKLVTAISKNISQKGVGVQCRVTENGSTKGKGARKGGPPSLKIVDKYPIWVDLGSADNIGARSHFKERKRFLQVARFGDSDMMHHLTNNDATEGSTFTISPKTLVLCKAKSEDGSEENQSDSQHSPSASTTFQAQDDHAKADVAKAMYRARYRKQFPVQERLNSRRREDKEGGSGINSLLDLRDDMQRMTQRLHELETCANSIDEEFKVSQKRLSRIGDTRASGASSQSRLLQDIDEALEMTEDDSQGERKTTRGLLSKNASSNLNAAKKLLEAIEQLAISADD